VSVIKLHISENGLWLQATYWSISLPYWNFAKIRILLCSKKMCAARHWAIVEFISANLTAV